MSERNSCNVIILAGGSDFGRCPLAASVPTAFWPVGRKPAVKRLLDLLAEQGVTEATICLASDLAVTDESALQADGIRLELLRETLPAGTAGAIRDAAKGRTEALYLVFPASIVSPPRIKVLIEAHRQGRSPLTVFFNPAGQDGQTVGDACGIYAFDGEILHHIPNAGYFDIKEGLVPQMLRAGKKVHAAVLPRHAGNFRDRRGYLAAIADYLYNSTQPGQNPTKRNKRTGSAGVWIAPNAKVHPTAVVHPPAIILDGARVSERALIMGPTVLGRNVNVASDAIVVNSVIWDHARLEPKCQLRNSLVGPAAVVGYGCSVHDSSVARQAHAAPRAAISYLSQTARQIDARLKDGLDALCDSIRRKMPGQVQAGAKSSVKYVGILLVLAAFFWSYAPQLADLWTQWQRSDEYSSGLLVPFLAMYVIWTRRNDLSTCPIRPSIWLGLLAFAGAQAFRLLGLHFVVATAERLSVVFTIGALVLLLFGWRFFARVFTVLLFLLLMVPWPGPIQQRVALPLQSWATTSAVFCLETLGYDVVRYGNVLDVEGTLVEVAWACNGLRMVTAFFVIGGLVALLVKRAWWEKLIVFASSLPVALLCNTVRLTVTAIAFTTLDGEKWKGVFHDFGGYAMMPLALAAVVAELWLLRKLTTPPEERKAIIITRQGG